jgi:RNA polymerase sigma-70 factor (sigma-E family)
MVDDGAFEVFVRVHSPSLLATALLLTGSRHAAEDLVQDTLTHLYPRWGSTVAVAEVPIAYVRRCLSNRYLSSRRSAASRELAIAELPDGWDGSNLSDSVVVRREAWEVLVRLPQRQRAALVLRYYHDLPDPDIAEILGCRSATVRTLISRALRTLRAGKATPLRTEAT